MMETQSSGELDCENDATPSVRSNPRTVRKAISLKLKGKSKGGKGGRGRNTRAAKKAEEAAAVLDVTAIAAESLSSKSEVLTDVEPMEQDKPTFDMEQDIFKLEAPTFTTIDRGPPEPIHNNSKLRWDHKVSLMGTKVLNPAIHVCKICSLPILLYGRMIPCKHVFCYECAVKSEKICPRCHEKVTRVEHTGLGTIHICIFGATKRNGSDGCNRTYLSHRDLQAHINHRHLRQPATTTAAPAPTNSVATTAKTGEGSRGAGGGSSSLTLSHSHHHHSSASALDYRTRGHSRGHPAESNYRSSQVSMNAYSSEVQHGYDQRTNQLLAAASGATQQTVLTPYSLTVVPQTVSAAVALQQQVVATVASISGVQGVTYTTAIPVMSVQAASNMPQSRTNLITVPIHDDSNANAAAEYLYQQQQQQQQAFQMPPLVGPPYTAPPPTVTYQTTATYVGTPQAPVTSFPPPPYPPPPIYQPGQLPPPPPPAHMHPQPRYPTGPIPMRPRFGTPPPPAHYEDHSHLASMQYPPNLWSQQQQQQQAQQTQARSNGPPPLIQPQQRFY